MKRSETEPERAEPEQTPNLVEPARSAVQTDENQVQTDENQTECSSNGKDLLVLSQFERVLIRLNGASHPFERNPTHAYFPDPPTIQE